MKKSRAPKYWLDLDASQRKGILLLLILMIASLAYFFYVRFQPIKSSDFLDLDDADINRIQTHIDSLNREKQREEKKTKIYPFNPNFLTDYKGYQLGMTSDEIDRLISYREADNWVNSSSEFQKVTLVSDSLLKEIEPYFKFPDFVKKESASSKTSESNTTLPKKDINEATLEELTSISGIGEVLGKRIIHQKNRLGGYLDLIQLKDVWGLKYDVRQKLNERFYANPPENFQKQDLNEITVINLTEIPYFDYELAREVINFRQLNEGIDNFDDLAKIQDFPYHKIDRIKLYLVINK